MSQVTVLIQLLGYPNQEVVFLNFHGKDIYPDILH